MQGRRPWWVWALVGLAALVAGLAGLAALGGLVMASRTYRLTKRGQLTDRYMKAVEQLGSDQLDVRLGGIDALERIAKDSAQPGEDTPIKQIPYLRYRVADVQAALRMLGRQPRRFGRKGSTGGRPGSSCRTTSWRPTAARTRGPRSPKRKASIRLEHRVRGVIHANT